MAHKGANVRIAGCTNNAITPLMQKRFWTNRVSLIVRLLQPTCLLILFTHTLSTIAQYFLETHTFLR